MLSAYPLLISFLMILRIFVLHFIIIIVTEIWIIIYSHCLGLGHETMVCMSCWVIDCTLPMDTWRNDNVIITSKRRQNDVMMALLFRNLRTLLGMPITHNAFHLQAQFSYWKQAILTSYGQLVWPGPGMQLTQRIVGLPSARDFTVNVKMAYIRVTHWLLILQDNETK